MLCFVEPSAGDIEDQALLIAMAPGIDFRPHGRAPDKWVVWRDAAVFSQADNLPEIGCQVLRFFAIFESFADGERERTVGKERHSPTVVIVRILQRHCLENHMQVLELAAVEARARHLCTICGGGSRGVGQIDDVVLREIRMQNDVEQPRLAAGMHRRDPADRLSLQRAVFDHAQPTDTLRYEYRAVRQKRHRPRMIQPFGDLGDLVAGLDHFGWLRRRRQPTHGFGRLGHRRCTNGGSDRDNRN